MVERQRNPDDERRRYNASPTRPRSRSRTTLSKAPATSRATDAQSPGRGWRNKRIVGYHGVSSRPSIQRQSASCFSSTQVGRPSVPARCAGMPSTQITRSSAHIAAAACGISRVRGRFALDPAAAGRRGDG